MAPRSPITVWVILANLAGSAPALCEAPATRNVVHSAGTVVIGATAIEKQERRWTLRGPCVIRHAAAQFVLLAKGDLTVTPLSRNGTHIHITGRFTSSSGFGRAHVMQHGDSIALRFPTDSEILLLTPEALADVQQKVDEARLKAEDPTEVVSYVYEQAALGNFAPMIQMGKSSRELSSLTDDKLRRRVAEILQKRPEELADTPRDRLLRELWAREFWLEALEVVRIQADAVVVSKGKRASFAVDRITGFSSGTVIHDGGQWRFQ